MKPIPNHNRVLVQKIIVDQKETASGILLPGTADKEEKQQGKIIAVGDDLDEREGIGAKGKYKIPGKYKVGEVVFYGKYAGDDLKITEKGKEIEYKLLLDEDILGWIK